MSSWLCRPVLSTVLVLVTVVAGGCAWIGVGGPDTSGWTPVPTSPDADLLAEAVDLCLVQDGMAPELADAEVIQDQRGPDAAAFLWLGPEGEASCFASRDGMGRVSTSGRWSSGGSGIGSGLMVTGTDCGPPSMVTGSVDPAAAGVEVETGSGLLVTASVGHGRFIAWWPGRSSPVTVRSLAADGSVLREAPGDPFDGEFRDPQGGPPCGPP